MFIVFEKITYSVSTFQVVNKFHLLVPIKSTVLQILRYRAISEKTINKKHLKKHLVLK